MHKPQRWKKIRPAHLPAVKTFLLDREPFCVGACSRFLTGYNHAWAFRNLRGDIVAFLLHSRLSLYPVFSANPSLPLPKFFSRFLHNIPIHAVQGLKEDAEILEEGMEGLGCPAVEKIDYDLMTLDKEPPSECFQQGPPDLVLRKPTAEDIEGLYLLHAAYEQEEVIPRCGEFNPAVCRKTLEKLLASQQILTACLGGEIVGKINTNAVSFNRFQIGGVYVKPEYRGRSIAIRMSAFFFKELLSACSGLNLFVKKHNTAARKLYHRLGFVTKGDYRISYF